MVKMISDIADNIHRYPSLKDGTKVNKYYTYMSVMEQFKELLLAVDMKIALSDKLDFVYIVGSMPFKKRLMTLDKKLLMKTDKEMGGLKTPLLALKGSVWTDDIGPNEMFGGDWFNTDMTAIPMDGYGDVLFAAYDEARDIDAGLIAIPKRGKISIDVTILEDNVQKLHNIREQWNTVRHQTHWDEFDAMISNIVPAGVIANTIVAFGIATLDELKKMTYREMYESLVPYANPQFKFEYIRDNSTGLYEIVVGLPYTCLIQPELINLAEPQLEEWVVEGGLLTRTFMVSFNMFSMFKLGGANYEELFSKDELVNLRSEDSNQDTNSFSVSPSEELSKSSVVNMPYKPVFEIDSKSILATAVYTGVAEKGHSISLMNIMTPNAIKFHRDLIKLKLKPSLFFYVSYIDVATNTPIPANRYIVDYEGMVIVDKNMIAKDYSISIYMNLAEYQKYLDGDSLYDPE